MAAKRKSEEWANFAKKVKGKRTNKVGNDSSKQKASAVAIEEIILSSKEFTAQLLASEPTGALKKYCRMGAQEFVEFDGDEVTIDTLKDACNKHFKTRMPLGMACDILSGERGPSCSKMIHLANSKIIHVRFTKVQEMEKHSVKFSVDDDSGISSNNSFQPAATSTVNACSSVLPKVLKSVPVTKVMKSKMVAPPRSLGVSKMMKLGKAIIKTDSSFVKVELSDFNIASMTWSKPRIVNLKLEDESFATGGFRIAYKAKSQPDDGKLYVLKKYTSESLKNLQRLEETPHAHARKSVQLNALASNFAKQLCSELESEDYIKLSYNNLSYGTILETKEVITLEPFIDGQFLKHVNNDGTVIQTGTHIQLMAETFSHYSYSKSNKQLMVLDIQGSNEVMFDPEIATTWDTFDKNGELFFCMGNLSKDAIQTFFQHHQCNDICRFLKIESCSYTMENPTINSDETKDK